jgi:hypothetical protein
MQNLSIIEPKYPKPSKMPSTITKPIKLTNQIDEGEIPPKSSPKIIPQYNRTIMTPKGDSTLMHHFPSPSSKTRIETNSNFSGI